MDKQYENYVQNLEHKIEELTAEAENPIGLAHQLIELLLGCMAELKSYVMENGFKNVDEEIYFFKHIKPVFLSKLIYHNAIYKIETKKPYGNGKAIKKYIGNELAKLKRYFDNNLDFYKYYRTNNTYLDEKYFIRGKYDIKLSLDWIYQLKCPPFATANCPLRVEV